MAERPYTILSCGVSIDGYLDAATPERLVLSNDADLRRVDAVRADVDAILVGAATVRHDDPRLLVRDPWLRAARRERGLPEQPRKVTVTRGARLDPAGRFFATGDSEKLVYCAGPAVRRARERLGAVSTVVDAGDPVALECVVDDLWHRGVRRLMVEGGGEVHTQFLVADLADELHLVVAPFFVGDPRAHRFVGAGAFPWHPGNRARLAETRQMGDVVLLRYVFVHARDRVGAVTRHDGRLPPATVRRSVRLPLRPAGGEVVEGRVHTFDGLADGREHVVVALGDRAAAPAPAGAGVPLVRVHSECLTGDALGSLRCDCGPQLREAVSRIREVGGYLVYLRQEGRGIGLYNKIDAYALQDRGLDTFEANEALGFGSDERSYGVAAQMLLGLGVDRVDLLTNNPDKAAQLRAGGVRVERCLPTGLHLSPANGRYLAAKAWRGHLLPGLSD